MRRLVKKATLNEVLLYTPADLKSEVTKLYNQKNTKSKVPYETVFQAIVESGGNITKDIVNRIKRNNYTFGTSESDLIKNYIDNCLNGKIEVTEDTLNQFATAIKHCESNDSTYDYIYNSYMDGDIKSDYKLEDDKKVINELKNSISKLDNESMIALLGEVSTDTLNSLFSEDVIKTIGKGILDSKLDDEKFIMNLIKNFNLEDDIIKNNKSFKDYVEKLYEDKYPDKYQTPDGILYI